MEADTDAILDTFGKNEHHEENVLGGVFSAIAGIVLAQVLDLATAQQVIGIIAGTGGCRGPAPSPVPSGL